MTATIKYTATIQTMGDADSEYADRYVGALKSALAERFPNAEISVELDDSVSQSVILSDEAIEDEIRHVANEVWNRAEF